MALCVPCPAPAGGGSARGCAQYILGYSLTSKNASPQAQEQAAREYAALMDYASAREDRGVDVILERDGIRPSSVFCRNVSSLETAGQEIDIMAQLNGRTASAVRHDVISFTEQRTDAEIIEFTKRVFDRMGYAEHGQVIVVHRDTLVFESGGMYVTGAHVDGMIRNAEQVPGKMIDGKFEREVDAFKNPLPTTPLGRDVVAGPLVDGNAHAHVATATIDARTLRPQPLAHDRYHRDLALRQTEVEMGFAHDHGLYVVDFDQDGREHIRKSTPQERKGWRIEQSEQRLTSLARSYVREDGLDTYQDRADAIKAAANKYLDACHDRHEATFDAELYRLAATQAARLEERDGVVYARMMARGDGQAEPTPTDVVLPVIDRKVGDWHMHGGPLKPVEVAEKDFARALLADPGRVSRDIVASGKATFDQRDIDGYLSERITDSEMARKLSGLVLRDESVVGRTLDTEFPTYTTREQRDAENKLYDLAFEQASKRDTRFSSTILDHAIRDHEAANGYTLTSEQRIACRIGAERMLSMTQGEAGSGKTATQADVTRRYAEMQWRPIQGFTPTSAAAEELQRSTGVTSQNTSRAERMAEIKREPLAGPKHGLGIVDEVSALRVDHAVKLLESARYKEVNLSASGDLAQLKAVAPGDAGRIIAQACRDAGAYAEIKTVQRQKGEDVAWMREAVPRGGAAIRDGDRAAFRDYAAEFWDRGHVIQHADKKAAVLAQGHEVAEAVKAGERPMVPVASNNMALHINRAVRSELGHQGPHKFGMVNGVRDFVPGDRVVFGKNDKRFHVANGYLGEIVNATKEQIEVKLDSGYHVRFHPSEYTALDWGYATTTYKSQGGAEPLVVPSIGRADTASSAHVAFTRTRENLHIHTTMGREDFLDHLSSTRAMRPASSSRFVDHLVAETGGPDTPFARSMLRAMNEQNDPLRRMHDEFLTERKADLTTARAEVHARYAERVAADPTQRAAAKADRTRELREAFNDHRPVTFPQWCAQNRPLVERDAATREQVAHIGERREQLRQEKGLDRTRTVEQKPPSDQVKKPAAQAEQPTPGADRDALFAQRLAERKAQRAAQVERAAEPHEKRPGRAIVGDLVLAKPIVKHSKDGQAHTVPAGRHAVVAEVGPDGALGRIAVVYQLEPKSAGSLVEPLDRGTFLRHYNDRKLEVGEPYRQAVRDVILDVTNKSEMKRAAAEEQERKQNIERSQSRGMGRGM